MELRASASGVTDVRTGRFFPFKVFYVSPLVPNLLAKRNTRFFVRSVKIALRTVAGDTTTYGFLNSNVDNVASNLFLFTVVPSVAQAINLPFSEVNILCDKEAKLLAAWDANPTGCDIGIIAAEVEDV
jgi:hypothetical protein